MLKLLVYLTFLVISGSAEQNNSEILEKEHGLGYGSEWIYFPDGDGNLHYVNLSMTMTDEVLPNVDLPMTTTDEVLSNVNVSMTMNEVADNTELSMLSKDGGILKFSVCRIKFRLYNGTDTPYILLNEQGRAVNDNEQDVTTNIMRLHQPIKLVTHGWLSSADLQHILNVKNAYLQTQKVNVITVDWSCIARSFPYLYVARQTKSVGGRVASFLDGLKNEYNVTGDQLHLIGHSLGAHVMGIAASRTNIRVHRVTGLDPARPYFEYPLQVAENRLDASDAEIVDVIHTCAGVLGCQGAVGTVDFYPNQGSPPQPGCGNVVKFCEACSHCISFHYFLESINDPTAYPAYECDCWNDFLEHRCNKTGYMGDGVNKNMTGKYYLTTTVKNPFNFLGKNVTVHYND